MSEAKLIIAPLQYLGASFYQSNWPSPALFVCASGAGRQICLHGFQTRHHQYSGNKRQSKMLGLLNGIVDLFDQHSGSILPKHALSFRSR
jgi:hypothetical protein